MNEANLLGMRFDRPLQFFIAIALAAAYVWMYESWLSDDAASSEEEAPSLLSLSKRGERMRWRLANAAIVVVLLEVLFKGVHSWGIYFALLIVAGAYLSSPFLVTGGAGIALTPRQQATRRRWAIVPALLVLYKGTDFRVAPVNAVILVSAGLSFALLVLVPEPRE